MNILSITHRFLFALSVALLLPSFASAEMDATALKQQIQERSGRIKEFRTLLNDPDQSMRLAALDVMLKSNDVAMRELAYGVGFSSADDAMRAVCLKNKLADLQTIAIKIDKIGSPSDSQKKALGEWGGIYSFEIKKYDDKTGQFSSDGMYRKGNGQVSGVGMQFSQTNCSGSFTLGDGAVLVGELGCKGGWSGIFPGQINLQ